MSSQQQRQRRSVVVAGTSMLGVSSGGRGVKTSLPVTDQWTTSGYKPRPSLVAASTVSKDGPEMAGNVTSSSVVTNQTTTSSSNSISLRACDRSVLLDTLEADTRFLAKLKFRLVTVILFLKFLIARLSLDLC